MSLFSSQKIVTSTMMNDKLWNEKTRDSYYTTDEDKMPTSAESSEGSRSSVKTVEKILLRGHSQPQLLAQKQNQQGMVKA